jgi:hypothetical protein
VDSERTMRLSQFLARTTSSCHRQYGVGASVRPLVDDARLPVRVAAVDVLLRLGEDDWLAEQLLGGALRRAAATTPDG